MKLSFRNRELDLTAPKIMGILNVTPDSFSDGGTHNKLDDAVRYAEKMVKEGAQIIDVGGESARPGAGEVSADEELSRVVPVVEKIARELDVMISLDTSKPEVISEGLNAGAHFVNDIRALKVPGALEIVAKTGCPVCLMHMQGDPRNMQENPSYKDLLGDINQFFYERIDVCLNAGIKRSNIIIDPGFGFGKTLDQNYELMGRLDTFASFGLPLLVGVSRKSMIGNLLRVPVDERVFGSVGLALYAVHKGAHILRVHDVRATFDALKCWEYANVFSHKAPRLKQIFKLGKKN
ncbi:MAG: dihydropteroate synthase [Succinimonas sp.]|nr:dihydropteroate synthase [Succinimonas sp.]